MRAEATSLKVCKGGSDPPFFNRLRWALDVDSRMLVRGVLCLDVIKEVAALSERCGIDFEQTFGIPSGIGNKSNEGSCSHDATPCDSNEVLVAAEGASHKDTIPPLLVKFAPEAGRHEPEDLFPELTQVVLAFFAMKASVRGAPIAPEHVFAECK